MTMLAFVDTETTGLDPDRHEVWEVGLVLADSAELGSFSEHEWLLPASAAKGDPIALEVSGFHERHPHGWERVGDEPDHYVNTLTFALEFGRLTHRAHLVGAVPSFDEQRLRKIVLGRGFQPGWHYHLIDVEAMAVGYLAGKHHGYHDSCDWLRSVHASIGCDMPLPDHERDTYVPWLPWKSDELSEACGVEPPSDAERHTALGDARWVYRLYKALVEG